MFRKHPLTNEFPEFETKIHDLKVEDEHFKKLFDEYDEVDHEIYRIESDAQPASDETANQLRITRLRLKDELYRMLKES
ncbi:MAG: YdcH family protein [Algoriphagus sp.]|uniref:YdcH family protein n=1 Tax=Algoriphagus sp. TaxID=1872435 RepID=UPI00273160D2|nr:YdcH family protein [Algoriphagus sp.]MDP2041993.1 YdcH family protein [Algoriphagus sp.]MDP3473398.1 YdcH family protein [Algoriphagus sp.]